VRCPRSEYPVSLRNRSHRALRLFRLAANHTVLFPVNQQRQPLTQQGMVIHHEDSLLPHSRSALRLRGLSHVHAIQYLSPEKDR
jgi:hypothetical protein